MLSSYCNQVFRVVCFLKNTLSMIQNQEKRFPLIPPKTVLILEIPTFFTRKVWLTRVRAAKIRESNFYTYLKIWREYREHTKCRRSVKSEVLFYKVVLRTAKIPQFRKYVGLFFSFDSYRILNKDRLASDYVTCTPTCNWNQQVILNKKVILISFILIH